MNIGLFQIVKLVSVIQKGQMVYYAMIVMVNVLVNPMSLVTNVISVVLVIGVFLHVKTVPVTLMAEKTILVISQVDNALVLIMFLDLNVMLVQLGGMVSQTVKNVIVTLLVLWVLVVLMMVEFVRAILDIEELNVMSVKQDFSWLMANAMLDAQLMTLHLEVMIFWSVESGMSMMTGRIVRKLVWPLKIVLFGLITLIK
jgi:hypothetical protein